MDRIKNFRLIFTFLGIACILFVLYTYTQTDLSLSLSKSEKLHSIQAFFQNIGYYNRPVSAVLFVGIMTFFFGIYLLILSSVRSNRLTIRQVWILVFLTAGILFFSYPAFSTDIFNYLFTAKTILVYAKNPYTVIPLQFYGFDPWVSVMRWIHLPSAYTPFWILLTLPFYLFGFGKLLLTIFSFRLLIVGFYLLTIYMLGIGMSKTHPKLSLYGMAFFAFNPLVLIECIVSPHNDIVMAAIALSGYVLYVFRKPVLSYLTLALSVATKLMTIVLYPAVFLSWNRRIVYWSMMASVVAGFARKELLPWYFMWVMPFAAINADSSFIVWITVMASFGLSFNYASYLYFGEYSGQMYFIRSIISTGPVAVTILYFLLKYAGRKFGVKVTSRFDSPTAKTKV